MAMQNAENGMVWGGYGAFKVIGNVTIRQSTYMTSCSILTETMRLSCIVFPDLAKHDGKMNKLLD